MPPCSSSRAARPHWRRSTVSLLSRRKALRFALSADRVIGPDGQGVAVSNRADARFDWQAALEALPALLKGRKGEAAVVVADQFVRYTLLQHNAGLKTDDQWLALARHRF